MTITKRDLNRLCKIARIINNADEEDPDLYDIWEELNDVIQNIQNTQD